MTVRKQFEKHFSKNNLKRVFDVHVICSGASGLDDLNQYAFRRQLDNQVDILSSKALAGTNRLPKYKLKLSKNGVRRSQFHSRPGTIAGYRSPQCSANVPSVTLAPSDDHRKTFGVVRHGLLGAHNEVLEKTMTTLTNTRPHSNSIGLY